MKGSSPKRATDLAHIKAAITICAAGGDGNYVPPYGRTTEHPPTRPSTALSGLRTKLELVATILLPNSVARAGMDRNRAGRLDEIPKTIQYLLGQDRIPRDGSNRISSAVLSTARPPKRNSFQNLRQLDEAIAHLTTR
jgi:hypothetical protein